MFHDDFALYNLIRVLVDDKRAALVPIVHYRVRHYEVFYLREIFLVLIKINVKLLSHFAELFVHTMYSISSL